ncbi:MAG: helix-turn-helix domain-containing protein [Lachnospiraceae bacterium]|nr:helix-turn-helix domain-containing protein [Lachnospiraceae bacterium]
MYKILIADDESIVTDGLQFIINKNFPDECTVECVNTGRKVIEAAEYFRPDIVFMDIQMPGINGIQAMREIRQGNDNTIFIVVSAFLKFDYAKDAIDIGVLEYLNKPVDKEKIVNALKKAMRRVDQMKSRRREDLENREKLEIVTPIIENGFIYALIYRNQTSEELDNFKKLLGIEETAGYVMALQFGESGSRDKMANPIGMSVRLQKEYTRIKDAVKSFFNCCVGTMMGNTILIFVPCNMPGQEAEYDLRIGSIENARKMVKELSTLFDARFRVGIGSVHELDDLSESYNEAMHSLTYNKSNSVVHVKDTQILSGFEEDYPIETENSLFKSIEEGNLTRTEYYARAFYDWMTETHGNNTEDIKLKVLEFVLRAEKVGFDSGGMVYRFSMRSSYLKSVLETKSSEELYEWFVTKLSDVCRNILSKKDDNTVDFIKSAQMYIAQNYSKDIILDDVSKELQMSPYYFSKLFKKRTGKNFIEYLTDVRIEKAKELLRNSTKSMKEICMEVGYTDPNYFSRTFKKNVGVTPSEYKDGKE